MMILQQTRGALSSGDQLALDLPFAATKSLTARVGPTPVFSRGSGATYVGSDGLIHGIDTSTTSNSISAGSKSFTLAATAGQDQLWRTGDAVEASNSGNSMVGTVTSYDASTQVLVCNMTSVAGTGTFTSWRIGYRGPRFDHDPANPTVCRGLLIEEGGRTNLLRQSGGLSTSPWAAQGGATLTPGFSAPDGSTGGVEVSGVTGSRTTQGSLSLTSGQVYTLSVFLKQGTASLGRVSFFDGTNFFVSTFTWSTLIASGTGGGSLNYTSTTTNFGNGWYRVTFTFTSTATASNADCSIGLMETGTIYAWGAQLEAGSLATSYILTTTGTAARSADVCSITGAAFSSFYNQSEGTLFADVSGLMDTSIGGGRQFVSISDGTYNNTISFAKTSGTALLSANARTNNITQIVYNNAYAPLTRYKIALGIKANDANASYNGSIGTTTTSVTVASTMNRLELRDPTGASAGQPSCHIAAIRYFRKRLPNAKLQALTA